MSHDDTNSTTGEREDASDLQQWIDGLLRSSDAAELEAAPTTMRAAATTAIKKYRSRRARRHSLAVFAAAATVAAIAMWPNTPLPRREGTGEGLATPLVVHPPEATSTIENPSPNPSLQGRGKFMTGADAIAMELESGSPDVTVVEVLPTIGAVGRREIALQYKFLDPSGS